MLLLSFVLARLYVETNIVLHERILKSLRREIALLEENDSFERTLLRGSKAGLTEQPSSGDIDVIMRSMMNIGPAATSSHTATPTSSSTPVYTNVPKDSYNDYNPEMTTTSGSGSGGPSRKRTVKGKGKSRGW